jgi:multicomponent Na+:H+ antiporter subunit G
LVTVKKNNMIEIIKNILIWGCLVSGSLFFAIGSIGLIRMPDVYTRIHSVSILDTLSAILLILGMVLYSGLNLTSLKLIIILFGLLYISSVASHALARASIHDGIQPIIKQSDGKLRKRYSRK